MIKIKNSQLDNETISILNEIVEADIKAVAAFKLMRIVKQLNEIVKDRQQGEVKLVNKFANKDENGELVRPKDKEGNPIQNTFEIPDEKLEEFNTEMNELLNYENDLEFEPINIEELGLETISVKKLMKIDFLFTV